MYWSLPASCRSIDIVWMGDSDVDPAIGHRSDPVLGADLVFTVVGDRCTVAIQGPVTRRRTYPHTPGADYIGVRSMPGAGSAIAGTGLYDLCDDAVPVSSVGATDLAPVVEAVLAARDLGCRAATVRDRLATGGVWHGGPHRVVTAALHRFSQASGRLRIADVADEIGVSERRLQRTFRSQVGLSPKQAARLIRIERLTHELRRFPDRDLAQLSVLAGFYDQAHMSAEVRRVLDTTPGALARELDQRNDGSASR